MLVLYDTVDVVWACIYYTVQRVIFEGQIIRGFRGSNILPTILPMNEATIPTFTCSASSIHEYIHELTNIVLYIIIADPRKLPAIR